MESHIRVVSRNSIKQDTGTQIQSQHSLASPHRTSAIYQSTSLRYISHLTTVNLGILHYKLWCHSGAATHSGTPDAPQSCSRHHGTIGGTRGSGDLAFHDVDCERPLHLDGCRIIRWEARSTPDIQRGCWVTRTRDAVGPDRELNFTLPSSERLSAAPNSSYKEA